MTTLTQGQQYMGGIVGFDTTTGLPLAQGATTNSVGNNVISASSLAPANPIDLNTNAPETPAPDSMEGDIARYGQMTAQTAEEKALQAKVDTGNTDITNILANLAGTPQEQTALEQQKVNPLREQQTKLEGDLGVQLAEYKAEETKYAKLNADIEAGAGAKGLTTSMVMGQQGAVDRQKLAVLNQKASSIALTQAQIASVKGDADEAQRQIDRAIDLRYKSQELEISTKQFQLGLIKDKLSGEQKKKADALTYALGKEKERLDEEKQTKKDIQSILLEAVKGGATSDIQNSISKATTTEEAIKLAGTSLVKPTTDVVKLDNGNTILIDKTTGKIIKNLGGGGTTSTTVNSIFSPLVNTVSSLETTVAGKKAVKDQMENYLKNEDYTGAYNQVANTVASGLSGETKNRFENARIDIEVMKGLREKIKTFQDAGGNTGLLTGTAESIIRKLGGVTDPKLTALAVELQREFQTYRNVMTGAAFTPAESREYESVNPSSKKSLNLNLATIDGAIGQLTNRVDGTIRAKVPQAKDLLTMNKVQDKDYQSMDKDFETFTGTSSGNATSKLNTWLGLPTK